MSETTRLAMTIPIVETESVYTISAHGLMFYTRGIDSTNIYYAITMPENVELYTYTEFGSLLRCNFTLADNVCKPKRSFSKLMEDIITPAYKYSHIPGQPNKFPNIFFEDENDVHKVKRFHSGITHCIQNADGTNTSSVIYSMDAKPGTQCSSDFVKPIVGRESTSYNSDKKYSEWYKKILETEHKCGPILLSEALEFIQKHSKETMGTDTKVTIKVYIQTCLEKKNLDLLLSEIRFTLESNPESNPESPKIKVFKERKNFDLKTKLKESSNIVKSISEFSKPITDYPILDYPILKKVLLIKSKLGNKTFIIKKENFFTTTRFKESAWRLFLQDCLTYAIDFFVKDKCIQYSSLPDNVEIVLTSDINYRNYRVIIGEMYKHLETLQLSGFIPDIPKIKKSQVDDYFRIVHQETLSGSGSIGLTPLYIPTTSSSSTSSSTKHGGSYKRTLYKIRSINKKVSKRKNYKKKKTIKAKKI